MRVSIGPRAFLRQRVGGVSRYFVRLAEELTSLGVDVRIHAPLHSNMHLSESRILRSDAVTPGRLRVPRQLCGAAGLVSAACWRPAIFHQSYYSLHRALIPGAREVVTVHDMIHELEPEYFANDTVTQEAKRRSVQRADAVICVSEATRRDLVRLIDVDEGKLHVVHLGVDQRPAGTEVAVHRSGILFVGPRDRYKRFDLLLMAVAILHSEGLDVEITAFGGGVATTAETELVASLGLRPNMIKWRTGSDTALQSAYRQAAAYVCTSTIEGFGLPSLEAMASGCPTVLSRSGSLPEVGGDGALYFEPGDPTSLADALRSVLTSPQAAALAADGGLKRAAAFSWSETAKQTLAIYESLIQ